MQLSSTLALRSGLTLALALVSVSRTARAQSAADLPDVLCFRSARDTSGGTTPRSGVYAMDYERQRLEPAALPIVGGTSDIGALLGVGGTLSFFRDGCRPYFWGMSAILAASSRTTPRGFEFVEQNIRWQMDIIGVLRGRLRLRPALFFSRTTGINYFGLGNGERAVQPEPFRGEPGRFNQFGSWDIWAFLDARFMVKRPFSIGLSMAYQYADPEVYRGSQLANEVAMRTASGEPLLYGVQKLHIWRTMVSAVVDRRDNELMPRRGYGVGVWGSFNRAFPLSSDVVYGSVGLSASVYVPVIGPLIFASRVVTDWQFGRVPFYDLFRGAGPYLIDMPGGVNGIRGVPAARYAGPIKMFANIEFRALLRQVRMFGQEFGIGPSVFFDFGRVFSDYTFSSPLDGPAPGIKWGAGLGALLRWGQAAVFRIEFAYSPDVAAVNPSFPFSFYVVDHLSF
ncbi:MAG: BamA/TamA family outer membrane protein [Myxococcales bacterium]|nr:BamA/TamA family outer membrane protein [Myxococcales bacterium]